MAYHSTGDKRDDQVLRKFFDAVYEVTPDNVSSVYNRIPKRTKWMMVSMIAATVLVLILFQLSRVAVDAIQWANRTPLAVRLVAPYDVHLRAVPALDTALYPDREIRVVDSAALELERVAAVEAARAALPVVEPVAEVVADTEVAAEPPTEGVVEPAVEAVAEVPTIDEAAIRASIQPEVDASYFLVLPSLLDLNRTYIYDNRTVHPAVGCVVVVEPAEELPCGLTHEPVFVEAADYTNANNQTVRVAAVRYEEAAHAQDAIWELFNYSRTQGSLSNYALTLTQPVGYFYASARGWRTFTWIHNDWVFSVSARSMAEVESVVQSLPF